jgi:hypothetical protein
MEVVVDPFHDMLGVARIEAVSDMDVLESLGETGRNDSRHVAPRTREQRLGTCDSRIVRNSD